MNTSLPGTPPDTFTGAVGIGLAGFDDLGFVYPLSSYILMNANNNAAIDPGNEGDLLPT